MGKIILTASLFAQCPPLRLQNTFRGLLLTSYKLSMRAVLRNIGPRSWQHGPSAHTKTTKGKYSPVWLKEARLVSSLLYGTRVMLVLKLLAFENKKYTSYDCHGNGPYGKLPTKKEPIRTLGFTPKLPCHIIMSIIFFISKQTITATATTLSPNLRLTEHNGFECAL